MKITIGKIRRIIREECYSGSHPNEAYDKALVDDPKMDEKSVYVSDDIKDVIRKWMNAMGLDGRKTGKKKSA